MSAPTRSRQPMDARIRQRRRQVAEEHRRRRRRLTLSLVAAAALAAGGVALTYTPLFAVVDVEVVGASGERQDTVRAAAAVEEGERLLGVDLGRVAEDVEALPWVRAAEVHRSAPSTVTIAVQPREPVAVVRVGEESWLVDAEGVVVSGGSADEVVRIDAPQAVMPGTGAPVADVAVRNALAAHSELPPDLREAVVRYDARSERGLRALLDGRVLDQGPDESIWVRLGTAEHLAAKAQVTELLLDQVRQQSDRLGDAPIGELDVRAPDNPVVIPQS